MKGTYKPKEHIKVNVGRVKRFASSNNMKGLLNFGNAAKEKSVENTKKSSRHNHDT